MKKIIYKAFSLALAAIVFSSCLKDDTMALDPDKAGENVVEFGNTGTPTSPAGAPVFAYTPLTLDPAVATSVIKASVRYAGVEDVAPSDIVVTLAAAPEAVDKWNAAYPNATAANKYNQLPAGSFTFPATVTIKKGEKVANFDISIKAALLNASISNVLGIKIASKTGPGVISGNFGTVIYNLPLKSIWDGKYTYTITNNYGTIDGNIGVAGFTEPDVELRTIGPNLLEVTLLSQTYGGYARYQFNGTNTSITSVVAYSGAVLASSIQEVVLVDPVAKKFILRWTWAGRGVQETWTRTGDR